MLACMVWGTYAVKIEVQIGCFVPNKSIVKTVDRQNSDLTNLLKSVRKKCPRVPG